MPRRIALGAYIKEQMVLVPVERILASARIRDITPRELNDELTILDIDDNGVVTAVYPPTTSSSVPTPEPQEEDDSPDELMDPPSVLEQAADRIFSPESESKAARRKK